MQIDLLVPDLMAHSRLRGAFDAASGELEQMAGTVLVVDVGTMASLGWERAISRAKAKGVSVIAFSPHSMAGRLAEAKRQGADLVAVNGDMLTDPMAVVRRLKALDQDPPTTP